VNWLGYGFCALTHVAVTVIALPSIPSSVIHAPETHPQISYTVITISLKASACLSGGETTRSQSIKIVPVGNSKGIRIPKPLLQKYGFSDSLILEETDQGLLLRGPTDAKLSWEDTYCAMALEDENWIDFDVALVDGLAEDFFMVAKTQGCLRLRSLSRDYNGPSPSRAIARQRQAKSIIEVSVLYCHANHPTAGT
jgi:antitoxin MazE